MNVVYKIKDKKYVEAIKTLLSETPNSAPKWSYLERNLSTEFIVHKNGELYDLLNEEGLTHWLEINTFQIGKWYQVKDNSKVLACYKGEGSGYGWGPSGYWLADLSINMTDFSNWEEAREEFVKKRLLHEAKSRNYTADNFIPIGCFDKGYSFYLTDISQWTVDLSESPSIRIWTQVSGKGGYLAFEDGKWAKTKMPQLPRIDGHQGVDKGAYIEFGCKTFNKEMLHDSFFMLIDSGFKLKVDGVQYYLDNKQVKELQTYLKNDINHG